MASKAAPLQRPDPICSTSPCLEGSGPTHTLCRCSWEHPSLLSPAAALVSPPHQRSGSFELKLPARLAGLSSFNQTLEFPNFQKDRERRGSWHSSPAQRALLPPLPHVHPAETWVSVAHTGQHLAVFIPTPA